MKNRGGNYNFACCIYPTAPFIQSKYLEEGLEKLKAGKATTAFSVTTFPYPIFRALKISDNKRMEMLWPEYHMSRSQDLPEAYHDAGQFYWVDVKKYMEERKIFSRDAIPVIIPRLLVQDIDTIEDWEFAEKMYNVISND